KRDPVSMPAARAVLRGVRWIHLDHRSTSFFRFEDDDRNELSPSGVADALREVVVSDHPLDIQILDPDALICLDGLSRLFEMKVASLSFDLQMLLRQQANRLLSPCASFDSARSPPPGSL